MVNPDDTEEFEGTDGVLGWIKYNRYVGFYLEATADTENSRHGLKVLMKSKEQLEKKDNSDPILI